MVDPNNQRWKMINLDRCCSHWHAGGYDASFPDLVFQDHQWLILWLKRRVFRARAPKICLPPAETPQSDLGHLALPPEIVNMIFDLIENQKDIISLAISHRLLSVAGWHRLVNVRRTPAANWAGDRIITVGHLAHELPKGVAPNKRRDVQRDVDNTDQDEIEEYGDDSRKPLFEFARKYYPEFAGVPSSQDRRWGGGGAWATRREILDNWRVNMFWATTAPLRYFPTYCEWVLCSITSREYVLASTITNIPRWQPDCEAHDYFIRDAKPKKSFDLGGLALFMTAWSSDMGPVGKPGIWAGHRLAIMPLDELSKVARGSWTDISKESRKRVELFMRDNHEYLQQDFAI